MKPLAPKQRPPVMTGKQIAILKALVRKNRDGSLLDIQQLLAVVAPGTSRGGMLMSLRHLLTHGFIEDGPKVTRRSRCMRTFTATKRGADRVRPGNLRTTP